MTDKNYIKLLRKATNANPLRILVSSCLVGIKCGINGDTYGDFDGVLKLLNYDNVKIITFCPEDFSFGTPREMCDIYGGDGLDVLDGKAKVLTASGIDWTDGMIKASLKMLQLAKAHDIEIALMMDTSAACGSQVIYNGNRYAVNKKHQIGMGVCGAQLSRAGFKIISQRDFAALEILYSKIDQYHIIDTGAKDHHESDWYLEYFKGRTEAGRKD